MTLKQVVILAIIVETLFYGLVMIVAYSPTDTSIKSPGGLDFRGMANPATVINRNTLLYIEGIREGNADKADETREILYRLTQDLPDEALNTKLMRQYLKLMESLRNAPKNSLYAGEYKLLVDELERIIKIDGATVYARTEIRRVRND